MRKFIFVLLDTAFLIGRAFPFAAMKGRLFGNTQNREVRLPIPRWQGLIFSYGKVCRLKYFGFAQWIPLRRHSPIQNRAWPSAAAVAHRLA